MGLSNKLSCEAGSFSCCRKTHRFFQSEALSLYFPVLEPWVAHSFSPVVPPGLSTHKCGTTQSASHHLPWSSSCCLASSPLHPSCPSLPLLPVWMNVSLTPWLLDFHTVRFSGSSGCIFVFKLVVVLLLVVRGGRVYLPMLPSWLKGSPFTY